MIFNDIIPDNNWDARKASLNLSQVRQRLKALFLKELAIVNYIRIRECQHQCLKEWFLPSQMKKPSKDILNEG